MTTLIRLNDDNEMNPYILGGSQSSNSNHHHHQLHNNNNAMFSLLRKAREPGANQADYVSATTNRALSASNTSPSHAALLFLAISASSIVATTLVLVRS